MKDLNNLSLIALSEEDFNNSNFNYDKLIEMHNLFFATNSLCDDCNCDCDHYDGCDDGNYD